MRSFAIKLIVFSFIIAAIDYCWNKFMDSNMFIPHVWFIFSFFFLITMIFHLLTMMSAKKKPQNFIRFYMGSTALRMMLCLIVIVAYRFVNKPTLIPFALAFIAHYFLFTIFEVTMLLRHLRKLN